MNNYNFKNPHEEQCFNRLIDIEKNDPELQNSWPIPAVYNAIRKPGLGMDKILNRLFEGYGDRPALGERAYQLVKSKNSYKNTKKYLNHFTTISYKELGEQVKSLACAWRYHRTHNINANEKIIFLGAGNNFGYVIADLACNFIQASAVPLQTSMSQKDLRELVNSLSPTVIVTPPDDLMEAVDLAIKCPSIRSIITTGFDPEINQHLELLALQGYLWVNQG